MKKVFGDKKFNLGLIVVLVILALLIAFSFFIQKINRNVIDDKAVSSISQQEKEDKAENKAEKKTEVNKSDISKHLDEGETLEGLINDFNTLPEGDEKEKVREKLEKIFEEAQESSPANAN